MVRLSFACVTGLVSATLLVAGCARAPQEVGPPPVPREAPETVVDSSYVPAAPVLPAPDGASDRTGPDASTNSAEPGPLDADVFSVQVFAAVDENRARDVGRRVGGIVTEPVEVLYESDNMWRVYAGRSVTRETIDALRDRIRDAGWGDAWTKRRMVRNAGGDATLQSGEVVYSVQVFASSSRENAERIAADVRARTELPVEIVEIGGYVKVFVGKSPTRGPIDAERDRLRAAGYPDAWTYERQGE